MAPTEAEAYATIPRNSSNQSILSNEGGNVREASVGRRRWVVVSVSIVLAALVTFSLLAMCFLAFPTAKEHDDVRERHAHHFDKHLRVVKAEHEREEAAKVALAKNTSTHTSTRTSTETSTRTSTLTTSQTSTTTTTPLPDPTLFCFTIMQAEDTEIALMREQLAKGASIYGCDDWAVYSDTKTWLSPGPPVRLETTVVAAHLTNPTNGNSTKKDPNALQFLKVWDKVRVDGRYMKSNWVVKVDPDTVFFPERLKASLKRARREPSDPALFANCRAEGHPHFMFGAIEVFSKATLEAFFQEGDRCKKELEADQMWEERYMSHCLRLLKVPMVTDFDLLQDRHCDFGAPTVPCTADAAVAFHPLKTPAEYNACWDQAEAHWKELQKKREEADKDEEQPDKSEKERSSKDAEHREANGEKRQKSQAAEKETVDKKARKSAESHADGKRDSKAQTSSESHAEGKKAKDAKSLPEHLAKDKGAEAQHKEHARSGHEDDRSELAEHSKGFKEEGQHKEQARSGHEDDRSEPAEHSKDFKEEGDFVPILKA